MENKTVKVKRVFTWEYETSVESYKEYDENGNGIEEARVMDDEEIVMTEMSMGTPELMELFFMHVENEGKFDEFCNVTIQQVEFVGAED